MWKKRSAYRILVGKPEGKRPLERHKRRKEVNNKIRSIKISGDVLWIGFFLAQDRAQCRALVNKVMNLRVP
jgi:hypothetical protein